MKKLYPALILLLVFTACGPNEEELMNRGISALEAQKFEEAVKYFDRVIGENPDHTTAHNAKGVAFFEMGKLDKAIESFNASIAVDSTSYKPFFNRGNAYLEKKEFNKAIIDYNYANGLDPGQEDIFYNRGLALLNLEAYADAVFDFGMALQINPNQPEVYFNMAKAQLGNNEPVAAMTSLTNTIALDKRNAAAYYLLGITELSTQNKRDTGCSNLEMALSLGYTEAKTWIDRLCTN